MNAQVAKRIHQCMWCRNVGKMLADQFAQKLAKICRFRKVHVSAEVRICAREDDVQSNIFKENRSSIWALHGSYTLSQITSFRGKAESIK